MIVDLLRHGTTGRAGCIDGRSDWPLTDEGREQMRRQTVGRSYAAVWSSPLRRAREPAQLIAQRLQVPLHIDADWAEYDFGSWDGRRRDDILATPHGSTALDAFHADPVVNPPPGGEDWRAFEARIGAGLARMLDGASPALVVTHAGPMRVALSQALGLPLERLWSLRIGYGTRIRVELGRAGDGSLWGEIVELSQP